MSNPKKTPLADHHESLGARMVDFSGWWMPVQYSGILDEHYAVRKSAGVFDISHMGEFFMSGPSACEFLDGLLTNSVSTLQPGKGQYTLMLNEEGGVIDDLIIYQIAEEEYLLIVNAAKIKEDEQWVLQQLNGKAGVEFHNRSEEFSALAVQGPETGRIYTELFGRTMPARNSIEVVETDFGSGWAGITGYTGEEGFEVFLNTNDPVQAAGLFDLVVRSGAKPCGLGARDTLRLEMCYPLNGSDLSPEHTPLEAGLGFAVDLNKPDFVGKKVLTAQKENGLSRRLVALKIEGKAPPPRSHYPVLHANVPIGETTSGVMSPSLGEGIAMAYLPTEFAKRDTQLQIEIRGRHFPASVVAKPFYNKS